MLLKGSTFFSYINTFSVSYTIYSGNDDFDIQSFCRNQEE